MNNKNRENNQDFFPLSTDEDFNSVVMEHEMTGAVPAINAEEQKAYEEDFQNRREQSNENSRGKGKSTGTKR